VEWRDRLTEIKESIPSFLLGVAPLIPVGIPEMFLGACC